MGESVWALVVGLIATIVAMTPLMALQELRGRVLRQVVREAGFDPAEILAPEDARVIAQRADDRLSELGWLRTADVLSLLPVYPALIVNAFVRVDTLSPWFVAACCTPSYAAIAYAFIRWA